MSLEQTQTPPDELPFSRLELSTEVHGVHAVIIRPQENPGSLVPNPPYSLRQQTFNMLSDDETETQEVGTFNLEWMSPDLMYSGEQFGTFQFSGVNLEPDFQSQMDEASGQRIPGIGKDLYRHVASHAVPPDGMRFQDQNLPYFLISHASNLNDASRGMWNSLVKSGEASLLASGYYIFNTPANSGVSSVSTRVA